MTHSTSPGFSFRRIPSGLLYGLCSLSPSVIRRSAKTIWLLLLHPERAALVAGSSSRTVITSESITSATPGDGSSLNTSTPVGVSPYSLLTLSLLVSFIRISRDPGVAASIELLYPNSGLFAPWVVVTAVGAAVGAILMPAFWYRVLGLRSHRDVFIGGMVLMYTAVVIPWDILSVFWIPGVRGIGVPLWLPELVKTLVITVYCTIAGSHMPADPLVDEGHAKD